MILYDYKSTTPNYYLEKAQLNYKAANNNNKTELEVSENRYFLFILIFYILRTGKQI